MTPIEKKALELVNEVRADWKRHRTNIFIRGDDDKVEALCRAIERHEAFAQEVSDAVTYHWPGKSPPYFARFIIKKPDPLVEALTEINGEGGFDNYDHYAYSLRAALAARGLEITEKKQ